MTICNRLLLITLAIMISTLSPIAFSMPEQVCFFVLEKDLKLKLRMRAKVRYIDQNGDHDKGDIHGSHSTMIWKAAQTAQCLNTDVLIDEFNKKFSSSQGYYLTNVRVDIKYLRDCGLPGDKSVHSWMGAPREGSEYFKFTIFGGCKR